ncbi:HAMP domain-containing histidine kinase [Sphingomonas sp. S1-29]|uniref:sensor histidine kinase n=1 Tax=Sphingomonas sp. S1-29 TaxID=2991074 RepID=UPI00223F7947|nr:HAMP domain-containing sensor histidine kinase [Sphingomonas sp. S1-29]UZK71167.1 HAMP domain-containing histidine kinase [Sphingomonas sp. S1-29]
MLVAVALFVAQAINFGLLYRERQALRFSQITAPAITRIVDAAERLQSGRATPFERPRSRIRLEAANPINPEWARAAEVEEGIRQAALDSGLRLGRIATGIRDTDPLDPRLRKMSPRRAARITSLGGELVVAVEVPGRGWLVLNAPWPRTERTLVWQLIAQTLILYAFVLLPVLWIGRRVAQPLQTLATAAHAFTPGGPPAPVEERGPGDVRAVIAAYNGLSERVSAMLDEKDRMLGAIGHDLRTPLAALRVRIESVEDDNDRQRMADTIDEMTGMLEDILSLARLGRPSEPPTNVDLAALVDAVVDDFRDLGHEVAFEEAPRTRMHLRPSLMRRAVRNLIENAVKYAGACEVRVVIEPSRVAIEVCDRGPGIPIDKLDAVFDPFTRIETSRNRETGGIGLGLALTRAIVRDAGGRVSLANRAGGGLVARIELPRT